MRVAVIGSGATGVAAATALARPGIAVDVLDPGERHEAPAFVRELSARLRAGHEPTPAQRRSLVRGLTPRAWSHTLGQVARVAARRIDERGIEKLVLGSDFVFRGADRAVALNGGFMPRSAATGGLANAWGAACYSMRAEDLADWPLSAEELTEGYRRATRWLGVAGERDALHDAYPIHEELAPVSAGAFDPDSSFEGLLAAWARCRDHFARHGLRVGRSRLAVLRPGQGGERDCVRCGLCGYGCAIGAIWSPVHPLSALIAAGAVTHRPGVTVVAIETRGQFLVLKCRGTDGSDVEHGPYDRVCLAAGALSSLQIAARTLGIANTSVGVQDNDMYLVPLRARFEGANPAPRFTLSEAVWAMDPGIVSQGTAHLQLYRLSEPLLGPLGTIISSLPKVFGQLSRQALDGSAVGFLYTHSKLSRRIVAQIDRAGDLRVEVPGTTGEPDVLERFAALLERLAPEARLSMALSPMSARALPAGYSAHIGGTLPLTNEPRELSCAPSGELRGTQGVYVVDHSAVPAMPAQNVTFTGVANAFRTACGIASLYDQGGSSK